MEKVLEAKGLSKVFRNQRGIKNVSLEIMRGEIYGLLGPNGAGKTTLMKVLTGLCRADQGQVNILDFDVSSQFEQAMARVGCIVETGDVYEYLSGRKNLELAARFYPHIGRARMDEVLELVRLTEFSHEKVQGYSLGMRQRLALAAAIYAHPEFVILDEPTNGLDIAGTTDIRNLILALAREQRITFLISSHLAHDMELICSRIGIINDGSLIQEGNLTEILSSHSSLEEFFLAQTS